MNLFDADGLACKNCAEVDFFAPQTDAAASGDDNDFVVEWIVDVRQSLVDARGRLVDLGRTLHIQRLVRTLVVEDLDELVEAGLLLQKVSARGLGGFFFQGEMHSFMAAVLLRMSRFDPFDTDSEPEPPHRELTQVKQGVGRREGHAVIAADVRRQAPLLKKPLKYGESVGFFGGRESLTGQQVPAGMIGDGQRVAVLMIPQQELALEIRAPELIGVLAEG